MENIYELTGEYLELLEMASDPDTDPQALADTMESINAEIEDKADNYAKVIRSLSGDAEGIDVEIRRLQYRKSALLNNIDRMKGVLQTAMETTGKVKFKTALFSFNIQKNPAKLVLDDGAEIPERFLIPQTPKVDNAGIKDALKAGETLDFAHLEQGQSLRIR